MSLGAARVATGERHWPLWPFAAAGVLIVVVGVGLLPFTAIPTSSPCLCPVRAPCTCVAGGTVLNPLVLAMIVVGLGILSGTGLAALVRWARRPSRPV